MQRYYALRGIVGALPVFESAARLMSFTKAAEELGMTQPAISRRISKFENLLGAQVFRRSNNSLELTAEGRELLAAVELGLGHISKAAEQIHGRKEKAKLTVACGFSFASLWLQPRFSKFREMLGGLEAHLIASESPEALDPQMVDIRILWRDTSWPDREVRPLFPENVLPVCSPSFARRHSISADCANSLVKLAQLPLLHFNTEYSGDLDWPAWFQTQGLGYVQTDAVYFFDNYQFAIQAALEGEGIVLGPVYLIESFIMSGSLVQIGPRVHHRDVGLYIEFEQNRLSKARRDKIYDWLRSEGGYAI